MVGVRSAAVGLVDVHVGEPGMWPLGAARQVLRWAVLLARVSGLPLMGGRTGDLANGSVPAGVVTVGFWVSMLVASGLLGVQLIGRVRRRGERSVGSAVTAYAAAVAIAVAVAVTVVRAADGLTEAALARGPGAAEVAAMVDPAWGAAEPGGVGSTAGTAALVLVWASGWIYLVEMTGRVAVLLAVLGAIPLLADETWSPAAPRWRRQARRWALVVILSKPVLTVVLMGGVSVLVRADFELLRGWVASVAGAAGLVLLVSGPITAFQFTHVPAMAPAERGRCSSPGLLTRLRRGPVRRAGGVDERGDDHGASDAEHRAAADGPVRPVGRRPGAHRSGARRPRGRRCSARFPRTGEWIVVALLSALQRCRHGLRRGQARNTGESRIGSTGDGVVWPVVRELATPSVPAVTSAVLPTRASPFRRGTGNVKADTTGQLLGEPVPHMKAPSPWTAGASHAGGATARADTSGAARVVERAEPGGPSTGTGLSTADGTDGGGASDQVVSGSPVDGVSAVWPTQPDEADSVGGGVGGDGVSEAAETEVAGEAEAEPVSRAPWSLVILGRPALFAVEPSDGDTAGASTTRASTARASTARASTARTSTARASTGSGSPARGGVEGGGGVGGRGGAGGDAGDLHLIAVEVTARLTPKMLELLVYLAVHPHGVRRDAVVAALWPDTARARPANNLSALITRLRAALSDDLSSAVTGRSRSSGATATEVGSLVTTDGDRYLVDPDHVRVDYWSFLSLVDQGTAQGGRGVGREPRLSGTAVAALHAAHEVYGGPLADGLDGEWVLSVREATRRSFLDATARLVRHHVRDSPEVALRLLEKARNLDPANEKLYRDIIALQLRVGDDDGAQRTLRLLETQLADLDETVSESVAALARHIDRQHV